MNYESIRRLIRAAAPTRLFVGLSGGADSLAALIAVREAVAEMTPPIPVEAVHFEHGLRGRESREDAAFCRAFCRQRDIPVRVVALNVPTHRRHGESIEAAARRLRLACWCRLARRYPGCAVVLGHHRGDLRENLLLRLLRGGNASGLTGLRQLTRIGPVVLLRPLLGMERAAIEDYLRSRDIRDWRHDRTNDDNRFRRNYLRNRLLPELEAAVPGASAGLLRALAALRDDARALEQMTEEAAMRDDGSAAFWRALPNALRIRLLRRKIGGPHPPGHALLTAFNRLLALPDSPETRQLAIGPHRVVRLRCGRVTFTAAEPPAPREWRWAGDGDPCFGAEIVSRLPASAGITRKEAFFDADRLPETLRIAPPAPGEAMTPFGHTRAVKLKTLRTQCGFAVWETPPPLRTPDGVVIWAPLIRHSAFAPVTPETRRIVRIFLKELRNGTPHGT